MIQQKLISMKLRLYYIEQKHVANNNRSTKWRLPLSHPYKYSQGLYLYWQQKVSVIPGNALEMYKQDDREWNNVTMHISYTGRRKAVWIKKPCSSPTHLEKSWSPGWTLEQQDSSMQVWSWISILTIKILLPIFHCAKRSPFKLCCW